MTTIACNSDMMASDSAIDAGGIRGRHTKIFRVGSDIVGFAGDLPEGMKFTSWYKNKTGDKPSLVDSEALVLKRNGNIEYWDETMFPIVIKDKFTAIGSGAGPALAAMYAGATPTKAVKIACKVDIYTGLPVKTLKRKRD